MFLTHRLSLPKASEFRAKRYFPISDRRVCRCHEDLLVGESICIRRDPRAVLHLDFTAAFARVLRENSPVAQHLHEAERDERR